MQEQQLHMVLLQIAFSKVGRENKLFNNRVSFQLLAPYIIFFYSRLKKKHIQLSRKSFQTFFCGAIANKANQL